MNYTKNCKICFFGEIIEKDAKKNFLERNLYPKNEVKTKAMVNNFFWTEYNNQHKSLQHVLMDAVGNTQRNM